MKKEENPHVIKDEYDYVRSLERAGGGGSELSDSIMRDNAEAIAKARADVARSEMNVRERVMQNEHGHTAPLASAARAVSESFRKAWAQVKEIVGLEKKNEVKAHSNAGVYVPLSEQHQKEWNAKDQLEKLAGSVPTTAYEESAIKRDAARNINLKTANTLSPAELERSQQKHMKQHPEHQSSAPHTGAVREATTGKTYDRLGAEEKVSKAITHEHKRDVLSL